MEFQKIKKLLGHDSDNEFPKYFTKKMLQLILLQIFMIEIKK